jgi:Ca2+-binding EF-hand superfamily protein
MKGISILFLTLALLSPQSARSDEVSPPHDPRAAHAATDQNHNGEIERDEFDQRIIQNFYFADADKDGFVSLGQLNAFDEELLFQTADLDADARLSLVEFRTARSRNYADADTDGSDTLSVEEVVEAYNQ